MPRQAAGGERFFIVGLLIFDRLSSAQSPMPSPRPTPSKIEVQNTTPYGPYAGEAFSKFFS